MYTNEGDIHWAARVLYVSTFINFAITEGVGSTEIVRGRTGMLTS